ncbi:MAG: hypothetical protein DA408_08090 [Bacteroidetes bacterium]|nr:MAG: hypothetical protein C7N36_05770 [Bacteroidota bacterium]PTM13030.1 MAG: hypothetical protein DA408_08090 [Bacteroidota bacterium]
MSTLRLFRTLLGTFLLAGALLGSGCNTQKKVTDTTVAAPAATAANTFMNTMVRNQVQADWLSGSARLSFDDGSTSVGATANIIMQKDQAIWMSVKKFGFELARAMITPDSIFILDRINNEYAAEPLSYVAERFKLPADLALLQQLLLGNPVFLTTANAKADAQEAQLRWSAQEGDTRNDFWYTLPGYQLDRMEVQQAQQGRNLAIQLLNYQDAGTNRDFSYLRKITVNSKETGAAEIELQFTKIELNVPTTISFDIPPRYQKMAK